MALPVQTKIYNTFIGGLITEANPLVFPENAAKAISNVDIARTGIVSPRLGMNVEEGGFSSADSWTADDLKVVGMSTHEWEAPNGNGSISFAIIQIGGTLYFHNGGSDIISEEPIGSLDVSSFRTEENFDLFPMDMSAGAGRLFVVGKFISPFYVKYNESDNFFSAFKLNLQIRDLVGISETGDTSPDVTNAPVVAPDEDAIFEDTINTIELSEYIREINFIVLEPGTVITG